MQLDSNNINCFLDNIKNYLKEKRKNDLISLVDFGANTGLDRQESVLFFSLLSLPPNKCFIPVTIPYAMGKTWNTLKQYGILTDKEIFERIPDDNYDDGFVPLDEVDLILNYQVCNE